mgnify:CR=1 FL=1
MQNKRQAVLFAALDVGKIRDFLFLPDGTILTAMENTDDFVIATEEMLDNMGYFVTDPWSAATYSYEIRENVKDSYSEIDKSIPVYVCEYFVECNDMVNVSVYGFGDTPNDALEDCQRYIELLKSFRKEEENG